MILRIGLTGSIGSGKSTVARIFEVLGIPVYYADVEAKRIMNGDMQLKKEIIRHFGDSAYDEKGLNRSYLASQVFNNKEKLSILNSIVHPATIRDSKEWMQKQVTPYAIKEAALIFETGTHEFLDYVIGVSAPENLRIKRAMQRDNLSRAEVSLRMAKQIEEVIKMHLCDFIIYNDEQRPLVQQVLKLHSDLSDLAKKNQIQ